MDIDKQKSGLRTGTEKCSPPFFYTGEQSEHSSREQKTVPCKRTHLALKQGRQNGIDNLFSVRDSFIRNFYWDGQTAKKLSVLKPQKFRTSVFFSFSAS